MGRSYIARGHALWDDNERRHIYLFLVIWALLSVYAVWRATQTGKWGLTTFGNDLLSAFIWSTFAMGAFFLWMFKGEGIVPFRLILKRMVQASLVFGFVTIFLLYYAVTLEVQDNPDETMPTGASLVLAILVFYLVGLLICLLSLLIVYVVTMGLVGVIYLFTVGMAPAFLRRVRNLTEGDRWYCSIFTWLFFIPENLDTSTLHADRPVREEEFPWAKFRRAVGWQMLFALLVAILVSLNPFLLEAVSIETLFNILDSAHIIVPMIFLPSMVFLRLNARIDGPVKDFHIYSGIRTRLVRTFLAIGSVVIFIRLALKDLDPEMLLLHLTLYSIISLSMIIAFTWLYLNYVETRLTERVLERAPWLLDDDVSEEEPRGGDERDDDNGEDGDSEGDGGDEEVPDDGSEPDPTGT
jgi:hypothetical protein